MFGPTGCRLDTFMQACRQVLSYDSSEQVEHWQSTLCIRGGADSAEDVCPGPLPPCKKRLSWQRQASPLSEAPLFAPKRPLLGSFQPSASSSESTPASQVGALASFPPVCPSKPYIGAPGTVQQAYSLALQLQVTEWVRLARLAPRIALPCPRS